MSTQNTKSTARGTRFIKKNDGNLTKQFVEEISNNTLNQAKQYVDGKLQSISWQQHKLTEHNGQSIQKNLYNAKGNLEALGAGNYYVTSVPDLPGIVESYEGYLSVFVKDDANKLFNFTPSNSKKSLYTINHQWSVRFTMGYT